MEGREGRWRFDKLELPRALRDKFREKRGYRGSLFTSRDKEENAHWFIRIAMIHNIVYWIYPQINHVI